MDDTTHPAAAADPARIPVILRYFQWHHLPPGPLAEASAPFATLAAEIADNLPDNAERAVALRKLLEAKDAAVRAAIDLR